MRSLVVLGAAALMVTALAGEASAQTRMGGSGFSGGGGLRGAAIGTGFRGSSFRGAAIGGGFRGARVSGARFANVGGWRGGSAWSGRRVAWGGHRWHRRGFGWGVPIAVGLGFAAASSYAYGYGDSCLRWNGYDWVNVCYSSYAYDYGPNPYPYPYTGYGPYPYW